MTFCRAVIHGSNEGDWKTMPRSGPGPAISLPAMMIPPSVMSDSPASIINCVDLPQPEWPMTQTNSPLAMSKLKSLTITARPPSGFG